jgi:hypothetical protein
VSGALTSIPGRVNDGTLEAIPGGYRLWKTGISLGTLLRKGRSWVAVPTDSRSDVAHAPFATRDAAIDYLLEALS